MSVYVIRRMNIRRRLDQDVYAAFKCVKSFRLCKKMWNNENQSYCTCQPNTKPLYLKYNVRMNARCLCAKNTKQKTEELISFSFSSLIKLNQTFSFFPLSQTTMNSRDWDYKMLCLHTVPSVPISFFRFNFFFYLRSHLTSFRFEEILNEII